VFLVVEMLRARRNELAQLARGGVEPQDDVYAVMRVAYPAAFLAMFAEGWLRGAPPDGVAIAGWIVFASAKALKWWAISSLGGAWTFRVIVVPGDTLVTGGPYRLLRHPNYVAVVGEFVSVALLTGARAAGPVALLAFGALMLKRIKIENHALKSSNPELLKS
jgi:methyltransferase